MRKHTNIKIFNTKDYQTTAVEGASPFNRIFSIMLYKLQIYKKLPSSYTMSFYSLPTREQSANIPGTNGAFLTH